MTKINYFLSLVLLCGLSAFAQTNAWRSTTKEGLTPKESTTRVGFPEKFELFSLDQNALVEALKNAPKRDVSVRQAGINIMVPNAAGGMEIFNVLEASNFADGIQAEYPHIRAYVGNGVTDPYATLRLSTGSRGVQGMIFRQGTTTEFFEPYAENASVYAVFFASRNKGELPFVCSTPEKDLASDLSADLPQMRSALSTESSMQTYRLALSCNGEYAAYHGGTVAGALEGMNNTITRVNGVFERDLAVHLNIIDGNAAVVYTVAATDPYTGMNQWNGQLQSTLTSVIGEANYDVGHMFGRTGGGGNAGCIGCVCVNGQKGSGITSPIDAIPEGDTFDIDFVAHELGHQFGATHTFTNESEGSGTNVEPGSGSTIMGYAGITNQNIADHSDDYFVFISILQIQQNIANKTCPTRTPIAGVAPTIEAGSNYIIPKNTPFILEAQATDPDSMANLTYCWEQNDPVNTNIGAATGNNSFASATKTVGPNFRSYTPESKNYRFFPRIQSTLANQKVTSYAGGRIEALSSVARTLNFVATAREVITGVGRTAHDGMAVTVNGTAGPFEITSHSSSTALAAGSNQTITWDVAGTTANGVNTPYVDIYLSNPGGQIYQTLLASKVPNDGSEVVSMPANVAVQSRIMVRGHNHIFFDINNNMFPISAPVSGFAVSFGRNAGDQNKPVCQGNTVTYTIPYVAMAGFTGSTNFTISGLPAGVTHSFSPASRNSSGDVVLTVNVGNSTPVALHGLTVTATSGSTSKIIPFYLDVRSGDFSNVSLTTPANNAVGQSIAPRLSWSANAAASIYNVQVATDASFNNIVFQGSSNTNSITANGLNQNTTYYWRVQGGNEACTGSYTSAFGFSTGETVCATTNSTGTRSISAGAPSSVTSTITVNSTTPISSLKVPVQVIHSYVSDLKISLRSPQGTEVVLIDRPCAEQNNINATFTDNGGSPLCATPAVAGNIRPVDLLSTFNGENPNGTWTLTVRDHEQGDGGTLSSWKLEICGEQNLSTTDAVAIADLAIYPNPNNGSFNVTFTPMEKEVNVTVFDVRGRSIFTKKYEANGIFQQSLDLGNPSSGVYFVQIENAGSRETRKIVVE